MFHLIMEGIKPVLSFSRIFFKNMRNLRVKTKESQKPKGSSDSSPPSTDQKAKSQEKSKLALPRSNKQLTSVRNRT